MIFNHMRELLQDYQLNPSWFVAGNPITPEERCQFWVMQKLFSLILKKSLKHNSSFIMLKLEELDVNWKGVRYLYRVYRRANLSMPFKQLREARLVHPHEKMLLNQLLEHSNWSRINCGQVTSLYNI